MPEATEEIRYLSAEGRERDDFGVAFTMREGEFVYDAKSFLGPWATMTQESFERHSVGKLGTGFGQKYQRTIDGKLVKVEG